MFPYSEVKVLEISKQLQYFYNGSDKSDMM